MPHIIFENEVLNILKNKKLIIEDNLILSLRFNNYVSTRGAAFQDLITCNVI